MQDAKTGGNRWVPDIREDEITEFQEQNGEQTATYKAVNVHPIISKVLDKLAFFRTHAAAVWYNKLANKTVNDKLDEIDTSISALSSKIVTLDKVYPIGSIYISYNSTNPSTLFGGIWEQIEGRFLLGVSSTYTVGSTGGSVSNTTSSGGNGNTGSASGNTGGSSSANTGSTTLTINQIPSHSHNYTLVGFRQSGTPGSVVGIYDPQGNSSTATTSTGGSQGHTHTMAHTHSVGSHTHSISSHTHTVNTLPPYIAVYMWRRTA